MSTLLEVSAQPIKIVGWRNMYTYLLENGYEGVKSVIKVCEEAKKRGFRVSPGVSLVFQINNLHL